MIEKPERPERKPNWHHTLYYKRNYEQHPHTLSWREHPVMIVPLPYYDHEDLHKAVLPVNTIASEELATYALYHCAAIQSHSDSLTHLEAFTTVRDELEDYHRCNQVSELGKEALKFSQQFTRQLEFMSEVPILGVDWTADWMKIREERLQRALLKLRLRKS